MADIALEKAWVPNPETVAEYRKLASNEYGSGALGTILFCVSVDDLEQSRGDLYVALGLAKYLRRLGWGITLWPQSRWAERTPEGIDFAIVMIESFVPGLVNDGTRVIAWIRNWTEKWCELPYLDAFSQIWCSSEASALRVRESFDGPVEVVPLATDIEIFFPIGGARVAEIVTTANFWGVSRGLIAVLSEISSSEPVTWFGKNAKHLQIPSTITHRHTIDYFSLPGVYSHWRFVVDDVIEAAATYGNHNSRLFDALACEALVATNTAVGLKELGLEAVPVYTDGSPLPGLITLLNDDGAATAMLAARLASIVREKHTWEVRAEHVSSILENLRVNTAAPAVHTALLLWATHTREALRESERMHNDLCQVHQELVRSHEQTSAQLDATRQRLADVAAELDLSVHARVGRLVRSLVRGRA